MPCWDFGTCTCVVARYLRISVDCGEPLETNARVKDPRARSPDLNWMPRSGISRLPAHSCEMASISIGGESPVIAPSSVPSRSNLLPSHLVKLIDVDLTRGSTINTTNALANKRCPTCIGDTTPGTDQTERPTVIFILFNGRVGDVFTWSTRCP